MGEAKDSVFRPEFNGAVSVEEAAESLTEDAGALMLREVADKLGVRGLLGNLLDHRVQHLVTHPLEELVLTRVLLMAQGWVDQDDADALRDDAALRMAVSSRRGDRPVQPARTALEPEGLPSQPTHSRTQAMLASEHNRRELSRILLETARHRMRAVHGRRRRMVLDVDSLFVAVYGHQEGVAYNGHYRDSGYHPLAAFTDTGDMVGVMLREGNVHTAKDVRRFLLPIISALLEDCDDLWVRMDAGYSDGKLMAWLQQRGVRFVTRLRVNPKLRRQVEAWSERTAKKWAAEPIADGEPREATREFWYRSPGWTRVIRVVCVMVERGLQRSGLFHHQFFLATNVARPLATSRQLLDCYRQRGTAEAHIGEFIGVVAPTMSSVQRIRQGAPHRKRKVGMAENEVCLLLAAIAYELMHAVRCILARVTDEGWSLRRVRERFLKGACTIVRHARQVVYRIAPTKTALWRLVAKALRQPMTTAEVAA